MAVVMVESGYRNVRSCYLRNMGTDPDTGIQEDVWTLFDECGRKCVCAYNRSALFFWVAENEIELVTIH